jgi:hypothetical protein
MGIALLMTTLAACGQSLVAGTGSGRLGAMAARQDICDLICYAKADGSISQAERVLILKEARAVLSHEEYLGFKQTLDRISPPKKPAAKQLAKTTRKKPAAVVKSESGLVIPTGAILPDGMARPAFLR